MSEMVERVMKALQLYGTDIDRQMARDAIESLREPNSGVVMPVAAKLGMSSGDVAKVWEAMISEILK